MEKIGEIKARFAEAEERLKKASMRTEAESAAGLLENLEQTYREDTRSGVQALIRQFGKAAGDAGKGNGADLSAAAV